MEWLFGWLYEPIGSMLAWFSSIFNGSYAMALLLYALLFKIVFLPFAIKQQKNQIKMAQLAPKIELIKAKYRGRNDQVTMQKQQEEIMTLQQKEGYNPMSGCLPMLIQFPIIIFLYDIIRNPLTYICKLSDESIATIRELIGEAAQNVDQMGLIAQINKAGINVADYGAQNPLPNFELFGANLGDTPSFTNLSWLVIIPVIAAVLTWLSMVLTRKWNANPATQTQDASANASLKMMDLMMPGMTLFMAYGFSSMMGIYWIYQSALGILQTFIISKAMPLPKFTEEDMKEFKKAQKEAEKNARTAAKNAPKVRSLHYIDDDDYDSLPEVNTTKKDDNSGQMDIPEI